MSDDRDNAQTRENIDRVARGFVETARKLGDNKTTFDDARRRTANARRVGDMKRDNNNR